MRKALILSTPQFSPAIKQKIAAISAMMLGVIFIAVVGFANISAVHNAAHDTRHSSAFPCH